MFGNSVYFDGKISNFRLRRGRFSPTKFKLISENFRLTSQ